MLSSVTRMTSFWSNWGHQVAKCGLQRLQLVVAVGHNITQVTQTLSIARNSDISLVIGLNIWKVTVTRECGKPICGDVWLKEQPQQDLTDESQWYRTNTMLQEACIETRIPYSEYDIIVTYSQTFGYKKMLN